MNIQEATKKAVSENKAITQQQNPTILFIPQLIHGWLISLNGEEVAMVNNDPAMWNPTYKDFLSNDWMVVDYDEIKIKNAIKGV